MTSAKTQMPPRLTRWALPVIGGLLLAVAGEGPDFGHYADWAWAALHGDIFDLRSNVLSPAGVPFTIAAAGPGLLFAIGKLALLPLPFGQAAMVTGWLAAVVFWSSALVVLRRLAAGDDRLVLVGAGVLFAGTHAGLYSHSFATEVFANALIAAAWALALTRQRWRLADCAAVGAMAGLLLLVRAHVVLYAAPALWLAAFGPGTPGRRLTRLIVTTVPVAIAAGQYALVNWAMTGSLLHPPYVYGGGGFSSVDMRNPELAAVLVHPWHGLLAYHPVYLLGFAAVVVNVWRCRTLRGFWLGTLLAAVAHVWVQAAWYIWWLGGSTFGMRGVAPAALPLVAGLVAAIRRSADDHPARASTWLWLAAGCTAWSLWLLFQGNSNFVSWRELLDAQRPALALLFVVLAGWAYTAVRCRRAPAAGFAAASRTLVAALLVSIVAYLAWQFAIRPAPLTRLLQGALAAGLIAGAAAIARRRPAGAPAAWSWDTLAAWAAVVLFAAQAALFTRLAVDTGRHLASGAAPPRAFDYVSASPVDELRTTYAEYLGVTGFDEEKRAFRHFLAWQRIAASGLPAADRDLAARVVAALQRDAVLGDVLVEVTARDGVVRLMGRGLTDTQQARAAAIVRAEPGVVRVDAAMD